MAGTLGHGNERRVKAFVDHKFHDAEPDELEVVPTRKRFVDVAFNPSSDSFRGRPLAGWAAAQISADSTIPGLRDG